MSYNGKLIAGLMLAVDKHFSQCDCGAIPDSVCVCGKPICNAHSYDANGNHKAEGLCADCCQVVIYETWMEAMYGRADA